MTVVIVGDPASRWVSDLGDALRRRGFKILALDNLAVIGLLVLSERIAAIVVNERAAPAGWEAARARLAKISPRTRILSAADDDRATLESVAEACAGAP